MDKDIKHKIDKNDIKQRNNTDITGDILQLQYATWNTLETDEKLECRYRELLMQYPSISINPLEASKQLYQIYRRQYSEFQAVTTAFTATPEKAFAKKRFESVFALTKKLVENLTDKMIDYGEWEEVRFDDIPENPFLEIDLSKRNDYTELLLSRFELLEKVNRHLEETIADDNKGKYMTISTLLSGMFFDIAAIIKHIG